jgi:hypothetical protein
MSVGDISPGLEAMMVQLGPWIHHIKAALDPLLGQPIIRMPYSLPLAQAQVIPPGGQNVVLNSTSFTFNLEWPMEVHEVKFSQDIAHTYRDWQVYIQDQTFNQPLQKNASSVADLVDDNTGKWVWRFPWTIRPKGGAMNVAVNNLDTVNPITVDMSFLGFLMIPR